MRLLLFLVNCLVPSCYYVPDKYCYAYKLFPVFYRENSCFDWKKFSTYVVLFFFFLCPPPIYYSANHLSFRIDFNVGVYVQLHTSHAGYNMTRTKCTWHILHSYKKNIYIYIFLSQIFINFIVKKVNNWEILFFL